MEPQGHDLSGIAGKKVLVVEDDQFLHNLLADHLKTLRDQGVKVIPAFNGEEALERAREQAPDIILLDVVLPGMNGFEVLQEIRNDPQLKDVPVVILSNLSMDKDIERGKELGVAEYIVKANFTLDQLVEKISDVLKTRD